MHIFIVGISGKMGRTVCDSALRFGDTVSGGIDLVKSAQYPTFATARDVNVPVDVIIDFSRPETLAEVIDLSTRLSCPCVLAATGYDDEQTEQIRKLSERVPVFRSANMSLGVNVLSLLVEKAASVLRDFDIEIVEKHHNQKQDAPSGTAIQLYEAAAKGRNATPDRVYGRVGKCPRHDGEIGIHAVRGGTIVGEHDVLFCGNDEVVTLSHTALSRKIFADGALKAAHFLQGKPAALYTMRDMLNVE